MPPQVDLDYWMEATASIAAAVAAANLQSYYSQWLTLFNLR